jgi:hypothetical protein
MLHLIGSGLSVKQHPPEARLRRRPSVVFLFYPGVLAFIAIVAILALNDIFTPFHTPGSSTTLIRSVFTGITIIVFLAASGIYLRLFLRWRTVFLYWYSLGLALFALGTIFLSQASIDSRLFWLGKASLYAGSIYFIIAVTRPLRTMKSPP